MVSDDNRVNWQLGRPSGAVELADGASAGVGDERAAGGGVPPYHRGSFAYLAVDTSTGGKLIVAAD